MTDDKVTLPIKRLDPTVELPSYAYEGDAGLDLRSNEDVTLAPFERKLVSTGLAIAIPEGYAGLVIPRSGLAAKHGVSIVNAPGLIDSGYRGEIKVVLINLDAKKPFEIKTGDRIAQIMFTPYAQACLEQQATLGETSRGTDGFGSSGVS